MMNCEQWTKSHFYNASPNIGKQLFLIIFIYFKSRRKFSIAFELFKMLWTQHIWDFREIYVKSAVQLSSHRTLSDTPVFGHFKHQLWDKHTEFSALDHQAKRLMGSVVYRTFPCLHEGSIKITLKSL